MSDFANAIAKPEFAFKGLSPDLIVGEATRRKDGKLWCMSGGFAYVFKYQTFFPDKFWAIKCFSKLPPNLALHYQTVSAYLAHSSVTHYFVFFRFVEKGIRTTDGKQHPILKMEWVDGANLKKYIRKNISDSNKLKKLAELFLKMCQDLAASGVGHGDFHHENIFVVEAAGKISLKLIDYDSFYVSDWKKDIDETTQGYDGYQHPLRSSQVTKRCLEVDYFSQLVIYLTILAFAEDESLWDKQGIDDCDGILFTVKDFRQPEKSSIFQTLSSYSGEVLRLTNILKSVCAIPDIYQILPLELMLASNQRKNNAWLSKSAVSNKRVQPVATKPVTLIQLPLTLLKFDDPKNSFGFLPTDSTKLIEQTKKKNWVQKSSKTASQNKAPSSTPVDLPQIPSSTPEKKWIPNPRKLSDDQQNNPQPIVSPTNLNSSNRSEAKYLPILFLAASVVIITILCNFVNSINNHKPHSANQKCFSKKIQQEFCLR